MILWGRVLTAFMIGVGAGAMGIYAHSFLVGLAVVSIGLAFKWTIEDSGDKK